MCFNEKRSRYYEKICRFNEKRSRYYEKRSPYNEKISCYKEKRSRYNDIIEWKKYYVDGSITSPCYVQNIYRQIQIKIDNFTNVYYTWNVFLAT